VRIKQLSALLFHKVQKIRYTTLLNYNK